MEITSNNWPEIMLSLYEQGCSDNAVCAKMKILKRTFDKHYRDNEKFRDLVDQGRELSQAWWEEQSRVNLQNPAFNTALYKARMQNLGGWVSKVESKTTYKDVDVEKLKQELAESLPSIMKIVHTHAPKQPQIAHEGTDVERE